MAAGSKQSYVRFHVRVDEALDRAVELTGLKRATLTAWIIETYIRKIGARLQSGELSLLPRAHEDALDSFPLLSAEQLSLSPLASLYALKIGRTAAHAPRTIGRPILLTLPSEVEGQLRMLADLCGMSVNHFRSAIVATFLIEQKVLQ